MLAKSLQAIESKFENITNSLAVDLKNQDCNCPQIDPSTRKPVKTSKPTHTETGRWPDGSYSLVEALEGCPESRLPDGRKIFSQAPADDYIYAADKDEKLNNLTNYLRPYLLLSKNTSTKLKYCRKSIVANSSSPWPKGSYCINIEGRKCLQGFHLEVLNYKITFDGHLHFFNTPFCCRSDQSASMPITLPTTTPFYLVRYVFL